MALVVPSITFALPASQKHPSHSPTSPSTSSPSFLNRITRKLSQSRSQLVRRVSKGAKASPVSSKAQSLHGGVDLDKDKEKEKEKENRPATQLGSSVASQHAPASPVSSTAPAPAPIAQPATPSPLKGANLRRGLHASVMRRTKSEAKRRGRILNEEDKMEALVRRTEAEAAGEGEGGEARQKTARKPSIREDWTEVHSNLGSYFWSDSLGVCWDGREKVHPDILFSFQPYSSNSDVVPPRAAPRTVYASTLSSFPPRPPLRPRTPEETPASRIIAEYRAQYGTMTPSVKSVMEGLSAQEGGSAEETPIDGGTLVATPAEPEPELDGVAMDIDEPEPEPEAPIPSSSSASPAAADPSLNASTSSTLRPTPTLPPFSSTLNPFSALPPSSTRSRTPSPSAAAPHAHARSVSPLSYSSAFSTPTSEPAHFQFAFAREDEEEGGVGGVRMSSEGSETSLESLARSANGGGGGAPGTETGKA
ncbi:hypothetical protein JCM10207_005848 [Rhodosporidiobolus poonsookiae]